VRVWINFRELRSKLNFADVLRHYNVEVKRKGAQLQGFCPLPSHQGSRNSRSFSANLERGIFHCFGCGAKGNVLEFAALMQSVDPSDGDGLRSVAVELQQRFFPRGPSGRTKVTTSSAAPEGRTTPVVVNGPLDFELKDLDAGHPYLAGRGFTRETMHFFGVGFCSRGLLKDRIATPLHDRDGKLLGYAGRVVDDSTITDENPRYRFPSRRERNGTVYEFRKALFLYNGFRLTTRDEPVIVVQDFESVWWLNQNGFTRAVATMGADCSDEQMEIILSLVLSAGQVWVMPNGDKEGEQFAQSLLVRLSPHRPVRWMKLRNGDRPTDLSKDELASCFTR
jgi:DNA primase